MPAAGAPPESPLRLGLMLVGIALLVGVPVATGLGPDVRPAGTADEPAPAALVETAAEAERETPITGVRTETVRRDGEMDRVQVALREDPPNRSVSEVLNVTRTSSANGSTAAAPPDVTVLNGSDRWVYNESADRVVYSETSGYWISDTQTFGPDTAVKLDAYEFTYEGTETVAGRRTHVVSMSPPADVLVELNVGVRDGENRRTLPLQRVDDEQLAVATETWWIDAEQPYPVQKRIEWANETGAVVMTTTRTYQELTIGVDHAPSTFRFEPPPDAEVVERNHSDLRHFDTREAANAAVPFELPPVAPAVPSGYRFQGASIPERENRTTVLLLFYDGTRSISVAVSDEPTPFGDDNIEEDLGAVDGTLVATDRGQTFLTWRCGELTYRLSGPTETERLVELAEEIGCSAAASDRRVNQTRV